MEYNTHSPAASHHKADIFLMNDQRPGSANTENSLCGAVMRDGKWFLSRAYIEALEAATRKKGAAWLREYAKSFDAAPVSAPYPTPVDGGELAIEFFARGLPSQR